MQRDTFLHWLNVVDFCLHIANIDDFLVQQQVFFGLSDQALFLLVKTPAVLGCFIQVLVVQFLQFTSQFAEMRHFEVPAARNLIIVISYLFFQLFKNLLFLNLASTGELLLRVLDYFHFILQTVIY